MTQDRSLPSAETIRREQQLEIFAHEYMADYNAAAAARRTLGSSASIAASRSWGSRALDDPKVQETIATLHKARVAVVQKYIDKDEIISRWWYHATLDVRECLEVRIGACRYCHGKDHKYHWRGPWEYKHRLKSNVDADLELPSDEGGYGYAKTMDPHPDCPECDGLGFEYTVFKDSRKMPPEISTAIQAVKIARDGSVEYKLPDKGKALENLARALGMFTDKLDVNVSADIATRLAEARKKLESKRR